MKVLLVNGSPNQNGCTNRALEEVAKTLEQESIESLYSPGILYDTGIEARITTKGEVEALYQAGRIVMRETLTGRYFPNLFELERLVDTFPGASETEAYVAYGENNLFYLTVSKMREITDFWDGNTSN